MSKQDESSTRIDLKNIQALGQSHIGWGKQVNKDRYLVRSLDSKSLLLAVADGLGGNPSSDIAAQMAMDHLSKTVTSIEKSERFKLEKNVWTIEAQISDKIKECPDLDGIATTLIYGVLDQHRLTWINVGDSRLYRMRNNQLSQISTDQALTQVLADEGEIAQDQTQTHYSRNLIDQCVGYGDCEPETGVLDIQKGDLLLFATDGLYKAVSNDTILSILSQPREIEHKGNALIQCVQDKKGKDDTTVVLAHIAA